MLACNFCPLASTMSRRDSQLGVEPRAPSAQAPQHPLHAQHAVGPALEVLQQQRVLQQLQLMCQLQMAQQANLQNAAAHIRSQQAVWLHNRVEYRPAATWLMCKVFIHAPVMQLHRMHTLWCPAVSCCVLMLGSAFALAWKCFCT